MATPAWSGCLSPERAAGVEVAVKAGWIRSGEPSCLEATRSPFESLSRRRSTRPRKREQHRSLFRD
jgi:hypothetical protein